jgi:hypothetical protein
LKLERKCDLPPRIPTAEEIENGIQYRYFCCPLALIPPGIFSWYQLYKYEKDFPSSPVPALRNRPRRFLIAYQYYEKKKQDYEVKVR